MSTFKTTAQRQRWRTFAVVLYDLFAGDEYERRYIYTEQQVRDLLATAPKVATQPWIDPNDKTQTQSLPHIGEQVLFKIGGRVYTGKHTGGSFKADYPLGRLFNTWQCLWMYPSALDGLSKAAIQPRKMVAAQEPFGYFKAEPFGWRDCAETDEGAIALYEAPQPQADALDTERLDWLIEQGCSHGVVYEGLDKSFWVVWLDGHDAHKDKHQIGRYHTAREAIDAASPKQQGWNRA